MYADSIPSRTTKVDGEEFLFFSGTAYLGIHTRPEFGELVKEGIDAYGTNYGASRLGNVSIPVFEQAENKIATWLDAPDALLVSSGTLAGRLILESLGADYTFHFASNAHVAINPPYVKHAPAEFHCSIEETLDTISFSGNERHVITLNTIDALTASIPSFDWIQRLPKDKKIILVVDDSHGIGVLGDAGRGLYKYVRAKHDDTIMIASLGKAMGLPAGVIVGGHEYISTARRHPMFGGSSPTIPAYLHAFLRADSIYDNALISLKHNIDYFLHGISGHDIFSFTNGFPVFCTDQQVLATYLEMNKIKISQFAYPSPKDKIYTRVILSGLHTTNDLDRLINLINIF